MPRFPFIAIEGVIGVGKTTLARLLAPVGNQPSFRLVRPRRSRTAFAGFQAFKN